jgi:hypothetical protein
MKVREKSQTKKKDDSHDKTESGTVHNEVDDAKSNGFTSEASEEQEKMKKIEKQQFESDVKSLNYLAFVFLFLVVLGFDAGIWISIRY